MSLSPWTPLDTYGWKSLASSTAESADAFVESLVALGPVVLFSAAVPHQGGEHHVNEQWQTYWAELFAARGFVAVDAVRPHFWNDEHVVWWYRQNTIMYVREEKLGEYPELNDARLRTHDHMLAVVHPVLLEKRNRKPQRPFPKAVVLRSWVRAGRQAVRGHG